MDSKKNVVSEIPRVEPSQPAAEKISMPTNVSADIATNPVEGDPEMSPFNQKLARSLRCWMGWGYLLLLLLLLLYLAYRIWRMQTRRRR